MTLPPMPCLSGDTFHYPLTRPQCFLRRFPNINDPELGVGTGNFDGNGNVTISVDHEYGVYCRKPFPDLVGNVFASVQLFGDDEHNHRRHGVLHTDPLQLR